MATTQPGSVLNLLLLVLCAGGGWFFAAWTKEPRQAKAVLASTAGASRNQPGVLAADARGVLTRATADSGEFKELTVRYGSGSPELLILAAPLFAKWAANDPADAAATGVAQCMAHTPDLLPQLFAALGAQEKCDSAQLLAAVPAGPLRGQSLEALAGALGGRAHAGILTGLTVLTRSERSHFLREWHRGRARADASAGEASAAALTDADDRESARAGCLRARAASDPEGALRDAARRDDYPAIAAAAFRAWLPRDATAAWKYVMSRTGDARLTELCVALFESEIPRRRFSEALPEIQSLLTRQFPAGAPPEVLDVVIPALARERTLTALKFVEFISGVTGPDSLQTPAAVVLFDTLCLTDPAAAWRLAGASVQKDGVTDKRSVNAWTSALSRRDATPAQRLAGGFPDFTDMARLTLHWLESDPATAIVTFAAPGVQAPLQRLVIEAALSSKGTAIPLPQLLQWAGPQAAHIPHTIEAVAADRK